MAILRDNKINNQTSIVIDKERAITRTVNQINNIALETFNSLVESQRRGIESVWSNKYLTPQEVIDALGENAIKIFQFHGALTDLITTIADADGIVVDLKSPSNAFTIDPVSGSITVTEDPYVAP